MSLAFREHEQAVRMLAKELEDDGYAVLVEPSPDKLPFALEGGYVPDLLATRADENLLVEVRSRQSADVMQRYRNVVDTVKAHPGWRFLIKTFADTASMKDEPPSSLSNPQEIRQYLAKAQGVASSGSPELAIPYFWNAIVALLRHKAARAQIDFARLSDRSLVNQLYTLGEISAEQHTMLLEWSTLRNRAVHDLGFSVESGCIRAMQVFAETLLGDVD